MSYVDEQKKNAEQGIPQPSIWQRILPWLPIVGIVLGVALLGYFVVWPAIKLDFKRQEMALQQFGQGNIGAGLALEAPDIINQFTRPRRF